MIDDRDVWAAALLLVKRYGDDAMLEASERADPAAREERQWPAPKIGAGKDDDEQVESGARSRSYPTPGNVSHITRSSNRKGESK